MAITYGRTITLIHWVLGNATYNRELHAFGEIVPSMLLRPVRVGISDQVRTAPYELDMSEPSNQRLDRSSYKLVHVGVNTSRDREHKQTAHASSPAPHVIHHCYKNPLPQCTPLVRWEVPLTRWWWKKRKFWVWLIYGSAQYVGESQKWMLAALQPYSGLILIYSSEGILFNKQSFGQWPLCEKRSGPRIDCIWTHG